MVDLAMSIFEFFTKFLIFWHPWVCIRSVFWKWNLKQIEAIPPSVQVFPALCMEKGCKNHRETLSILRVNLSIFVGFPTIGKTCIDPAMPCIYLQCGVNIIWLQLTKKLFRWAESCSEIGFIGHVDLKWFIVSSWANWMADFQSLVKCSFLLAHSHGIFSTGQSLFLWSFFHISTNFVHFYESVSSDFRIWR